MGGRIRKTESAFSTIHIFTRRRGAHAAHTQIGRPTHEAPTRENTRKHKHMSYLIIWRGASECWYAHVVESSAFCVLGIVPGARGAESAFSH